MNSRPGWQAIVHPDEAPASVERWLAALSAGRPFETEYRLRRADGVYRWRRAAHLFLDGVLIRLDGEQGGLRGFAKLGRDATAQRQAEEALQRARDELERHVEERTAALVASSQARQELLRQLMAAQEAERLRIARDLHDQLGQLITGLQLGLKQLEEPAQGTPLAASLPPLQSLAQDLAKEAHRLAVDLRPTDLDDVGLIPALERLVAGWGAQSQVTAAFHSSGLDGDRLPPALETTLYRVVQEALTNIHKHAAARNVSVLLER